MHLKTRKVKDKKEKQKAETKKVKSRIKYNYQQKYQRNNEEKTVYIDRNPNKTDEYKGNKEGITLSKIIDETQNTSKENNDKK